MTRISAVRGSNRRGFSLLEVVLSLSLSVILLGAIGAAIDQSWRLSSQGQVEMQRQQVARAVLRIMERDVRSVMFVPPSDFAEDEEETSSSSTTTAGAGTSSTTAAGSSSTAGTTSGGSEATGPGTTQPVVVLTSRGIRGDQFSIKIDGARPQRELAFATPVNEAIPSSQTSDLRTVTYRFAAANSSGNGGFSRQEGDRYATASAETQGKDAAANFSSAALAPEIAAMEFRYFDGVTWLTGWDSVAMGRLPRAVEVQLRFASAEVKRNSLLNAGVNRSTQIVRLVMHVPAADPVPEEEP